MFGVDAGGSVGIHAERVPAIQALEVVENVVVDEVAKSSAGRPAGNSADYSAKQGTGQAAKGGPGRASDGSDRCTDASASGRCCDAAGSTCNCAY
jgi:hypothetical protein